MSGIERQASISRTDPVICQDVGTSTDLISSFRFLDRVVRKIATAMPFSPIAAIDRRVWLSIYHLTRHALSTKTGLN